MNRSISLRSHDRNTLRTFCISTAAENGLMIKSETPAWAAVISESRSLRLVSMIKGMSWVFGLLRTLSRNSSPVMPGISQSLMIQSTLPPSSIYSRALLAVRNDLTFRQLSCSRNILETNKVTDCVSSTTRTVALLNTV